MIDISNGRMIPPIGIATLIAPNTVPADSGYFKPANVNIIGSNADREIPAKNRAR